MVIENPLVSSMLFPVLLPLNAIYKQVISQAMFDDTGRYSDLLWHGWSPQRS
jgi:hypothetical protein